MKLFGKKSNEKTISDRVSSENSNTINDVNSGIKILGSGCAKCNALEAVTKEALMELGYDSAIDHVTDYSEIVSYGVMSTPALVVDNKVVSYGRVLKKEEVKELIQKTRG